MGEIKKIDITGLSALCRKWLPAFQAAEHLCNIGIAGVLDSDNYVSLSDIVAESEYKASGTYRIISMAVRAGLVDKNPDGGRGPLYRATPRIKDVLSATIKAEQLYFLSKYKDVFYVLKSDPHNVSGLCDLTGTQQTTMSLQMKRLHVAGWVDRTQTGKEVWYSLSDYARKIMPVVAAELQGLK